MENPRNIRKMERMDCLEMFNQAEIWEIVLVYLFLEPNPEWHAENQDAAHEPECSHVLCYWYRCPNKWICNHAAHFSAIVCLDSLVHISPVTSLQCGVWSVACGVESVECGVRSVK